MKRPFKPTVDYWASFGLVDMDFTKDQLAGIGKVAMTYNETEASLYHLMSIAIGMDGSLFSEIAMRINGIDGVVAIISHVAERIGLPEDELVFVRETIGNGGFGFYKKCRDAVIHARSYNAPAGIGVRVERRAQVHEVLLTSEALELLGKHLAVIRHEMDHLADLVLDRKGLLDLVQSDSEKASNERFIRECFARAQECRNRRLSLAPIPEFPAESELRAARDNWKPLSELRIKPQE